MTTLEHTLWALGVSGATYALGMDYGKRRGVELTISFLRENDLLKEDIEDE